jgi:hypothetical protein
MPGFARAVGRLSLGQCDAGTLCSGVTGVHRVTVDAWSMRGRQPADPTSVAS